MDGWNVSWENKITRPICKDDRRSDFVKIADTKYGWEKILNSIIIILPVWLNKKLFINVVCPYTSFVPNLVEIGPVVLEDFKISSMYFRYFVIISPRKSALPFIFTNLISLHPKMLCAKFCWNWSCGSWGEDESLQTDARTDGRRTTDY